MRDAYVCFCSVYQQTPKKLVFDRNFLCKLNYSRRANEYYVLMIAKPSLSLFSQITPYIFKKNEKIANLSRERLVVKFLDRQLGHIVLQIHHEGHGI